MNGIQSISKQIEGTDLWSVAHTQREASTEIGVWIKYDGPRFTSSKIKILRYIAGHR